MTDPQENKRLNMLRRLVQSGQADSFARYALAMELRKADLIDEALSAFEDLRSSDAKYVPQYLMAAQMLSEKARTDEARAWLLQGKEAAQASGNSHALGEIEDALANL